MWDEARKNDPGELHADIPVIQGGMGVESACPVWPEQWQLPVGIGIISTAQIGFREPDFDRDPIACNLRTIGKEIEKARQIAKGGIVGVNIMVATQHYEDYVRAAVQAGTDCIISGAGLPLDLPGVVAETENGMPGRSHRTMLAPIVEPPCPVGRHEILDEKIRQKAGLYRGRGTVGRRSSGI